VKLGTGGLSRAYSGGVVKALEALPTEEKVERVDVDVVVGYADVDGIQRLVESLEILVVDEAYGSDVRLRLGVPREEVDTLRRRVADLTRGVGQVERVEE
jgi:putative IMPACT (imprinted ancient) family translation regulator